MPPNVVLLHCHDLGTYLGCYGAAVETPQIDALAADGVRFDRHFVTAPQCSPSRASLFTGRHPHRNGMLGLAHGHWELHADERVLPELLGEAGYETHLFGLQHITEYPDRLGYDHVHTEQPLTADTQPAVHESARARSVATAFDSVLKNGAYETPFFASVGFFELHRVEEDGGFGFERDRYDAPTAESVEPLEFLPDSPGIRSDIADAQGMLEAVDDAVGTVCNALERAGLTEDTVVVFTTEHGLAMPRAKGSCFDPGIEAALIVRYPNRLDGGQVVGDLVSNVDLFPTLLDLADGPEPPNPIDGQPLDVLLTGEETADHREQLFAGMTWHDRYNPIRAIRTDRFKYIWNGWHLPAVYLTTDIYRSDAGRDVRESYTGHQRPYEQLYDLETDPLEQENLMPTVREEFTATADRDLGTVYDHLRSALRAWMDRTDDPLLEGPVHPGDWETIQL